MAHYTFNEGRGEMIRDRSGAGRPAENHGATYIASPMGYALRFDGIDDHATYAGDRGLRVHDSFTLAVWLLTDPADGSGTTRLSFGDIARRSVDRNLNVKIDKYQRIHVEWGNGSRSAYMAADATCLAGGWHHLTATCDGDRSYAALYLDGRIIAETDVAFGPSMDVAGPQVRSGYWWENNAFRGDIDDIKLFDAALSAEHVRALATQRRETDTAVDKPLHPTIPDTVDLAGPLNRRGLVAHYTFDDGEGTQLTDHSGRGHHGTIHGATWTESPWGGALHFDGKDDFVNLGCPEDFWFSDYLTIEMWIRATPSYPAGRHPLLIGSSAADLAVERHVNVRLDHTKHFRVEWGDGAKYASAR